MNSFTEFFLIGFSFEQLDTLPYKLQAKVLILAQEDGIREILDHGSLTSLQKCIIHSPGISMNFVEQDIDDPVNNKANSRQRRKSVIAQNISIASRK
jgi:hypothetical protein